MAYSRRVSYESQASADPYLEYERALRLGQQPGYSSVSAGGGQRGLVAPAGFEVIPEEVVAMLGEDGAELDAEQRQADAAIASWRLGKTQSGTWAGASVLSLSTRGSDIDLKEFLKHRGHRKLEGLHKSAAQGDRVGIMHLMKHLGPNAPIDELDANGCTPLMYAAMADSHLAVEMLLNFSARREQTDPEGRTATHYAAFFGKHKALKFLIESASDWNPRDVYGRTPLHWVFANKNIKALEVLLQHAEVVNGDINPRDNEGMTPLHCAAHFGGSKHIALLSEAEIDFTAVDIEGKTALHWTASNTDSSCIQALLNVYPPLLNKKDINGYTALHLTANNGSTYLVRTLLETDGTDIDARDNLERTALHLASIEGHPEIVQLLLQFRALDSIVDVYGFTALHYAVQNNSIPAISAFAEVPEEVAHLPDGEGKTPLMTAAQNGFDKAAKVLVTSTVIAKSVNDVEINGRSALHLAALAGSAKCVSPLLSAGADPNLQDNFQQTPLFPACEGGHAATIEALIRGGCQPDSLDAESQAPLHKAVLCNQPDAIQALMLNGANLNIRDSTGSTALHMAAYGGNDPILALLVENSANPNLQDLNGMTAVHLAAMEGHSTTLVTLLTHRAYANFMDYSEDRYTPLDYAEFHGHSACVDILSKAGGVRTGTIREMAATSIQAAYRGYRARLLRSELSKQSHAVTVIAAHYRGYRQYKRYKEMKAREHAATKIQALVRGHLQRLKFRDQLASYREKEKQQKLIEDFSRRVVAERKDFFLHLFTAKFTEPGIMDGEQTLEPSVEEGVDKEEQLSREKKLRLETAMRMREIYAEKQKCWEQFREAEKQRRIDNSNREELDRLAAVLSRSRARREYTQSKIQQTLAVRSHYDAALIIQRAFRRMKRVRLQHQRKALEKDSRRRRRENRAAFVIQRAWRRYVQKKLFEALNFRSILTSPVISLPAHHPLPLNQLRGVQSYRKNISITGNPRRKVHLTEQGGFKVFRPTTTELLTKSGPLASKRSSRQVSGMYTGGKDVLTSEVKSSTVKKTSFSVTESGRVQRYTKGSNFPDLVPSSQSMRKPQTESKARDSKLTFHLPQIVNPSKI